MDGMHRDQYRVLHRLQEALDLTDSITAVHQCKKIHYRKSIARQI